jgi:hypothetical protein
MWAAVYNHNPEVITTLIQAGADTGAKCNEGKTALDYVRDRGEYKKEGKAEIIAILEKHTK